MIQVTPGDKFGRWAIISLAGIDRFGTPRWNCVCTCGTERDVSRRLLLNGESQSCGCLKDEITSARSKIHSLSKSPEYRSWRAMRGRCINKNLPDFAYYGARGIKPCARWEKFENFYADMGPRPSLAHTLDRIDNDGDYTPRNCRWATKKEQAAHRRPAGTVRKNGQLANGVAK